MRSKRTQKKVKMEVFVVGPSFRCSTFVFSVGSAVRDVLDRLVPHQLQDFYVSSNGHLSHLDDLLQHGAVYHLEPRLCGGKGGFGSMLRALGAQIEKTTNREACRDLSGRRLRDVNHEKEMADWLKQQAEREAEKEQRRLERLQRKLAEPKHQFTDPEFQQQCHDLSERLEDSVLKGLQASPSCQVKVGDCSAPKRSNTNQREPLPMKKKKKKTTTATPGFWTGLDDLDEFTSSEDDEGPSTSAVAMTTQREEAEPSSSTSPTTRPSDQRPPGLSSEDQRPPGLSSEDKRPPGLSSEDQGAPGLSSEDQRPPGLSSEDQRPPGLSSEDQGAPGLSSEDQGAPGLSSEDQGAPGLSSEDQRPPGLSSEDQRPPGLSSEDKRPPGLSSEDQGPSESSETSSPQQLDPPPQTPVLQLDLSSLTSVQQLESLGLDVLKKELVSRGLKCGGTLLERAARLFSVRGLSPDQIDPVLLAKPVKNKKK